MWVGQLPMELNNFYLYLQACKSNDTSHVKLYCYFLRNCIETFTKAKPLKILFWYNTETTSIDHYTEGNAVTYYQVTLCQKCITDLTHLKPTELFSCNSFLKVQKFQVLFQYNCISHLDDTKRNFPNRSAVLLLHCYVKYRWTALVGDTKEDTKVFKSLRSRHFKYIHLMQVILYSHIKLLNEGRCVSSLLRNFNTRLSIV